MIDDADRRVVIWNCGVVAVALAILAAVGWAAHTGRIDRRANMSDVRELEKRVRALEERAR
jgi:hypothetical protein